MISCHMGSWKVWARDSTPFNMFWMSVLGYVAMMTMKGLNSFFLCFFNIFDISGLLDLSISAIFMLLYIPVYT